MYARAATWEMKRSTGVENEDLACWSAGAKPALVSKLPFGGLAFRLLQVSYSKSYLRESESYYLRYAASIIVSLSR
jgi:hypothetical protein